MKKPNVILLMLDGVRSDSIDHVPFFKELKKESLFFSNFIVYAPYTLGSLHAILTGIYGNVNGVNGYYKSYSFDRKNCYTMAQYLKDHGYYTEADVINRDLIPEQGFDKIRVHNEFESDLAKRHPEILLQIKRKQPFFLFLDYNQVHTNLVKDVIKKYSDFDKEYFKNKDSNFNYYVGLVEKGGSYVKMLLNKLKEMEIYDNTIVLIFSDHGCSTGDRMGEKVYGVYLYDYTIKTFLYMIGKNLPKNIQSNNVVRSVDILPTVLNMLGIKEKSEYKKMHGESLLKALESKDDRIAYSETGGLGGPTPSPEEHNVKCVRNYSWKLIHNITNGRKELYDLKNDPYEKNDLSNIEKGKLNEMWEQMQNLEGKFKDENIVPK